MITSFVEAYNKVMADMTGRHVPEWYTDSDGVRTSTQSVWVEDPPLVLSPIPDETPDIDTVMEILGILNEPPPKLPKKKTRDLIL